MKTWLITGTSSGIGRRVAEVALEQGDRVVATARNAESIVDLVATHGDRCRAVTLDVTDARAISAVVAQAIEAFGTIDVLVNNAGIGLVGALEETDDALLRQNLETNLIAPLNLMRAVIPAMRQAGRGHLINISAIAAIGNEAGFGVYAAAKAGLIAATDAIATEVAPYGIKCTSVLPGPFRTDFIGRSLINAPRMPEYQATVGNFAKLLERIHGRQQGDPVKAARAIYQIAGVDAPPAKLVLGKYAYDKYAKKLKTAQAELEAWQQVGLPTDFGA